MCSTIDDYLHDLRKAVRNLPSEARERHLEEIEQHLRASAEEKGGGADGEQAAVAAFGKPSKIAQGIMALYPPSWKGVVAAAVALPISFTLMSIIPALVRKEPFNFAALICLFLFCYFSCRSGRFLVRQLLVAAILTVAILPAICCVLFVRNTLEAGDGLLPRWMALSYLVDAKMQLPNLKSMRETMQLSEEAYWHGSSTALAKLHTGAGYIVPDTLDTIICPAYQWKYTLETTTATTLSEAKAKWRQRGYFDTPSAADYYWGSQEIQAQLKAPLFSNYLTLFRSLGIVLLIYFAVLILINAVLATISYLVKRLFTRRSLANA